MLQQAVLASRRHKDSRVLTNRGRFDTIYLMRSIQSFSMDILGDLIRRQRPSPARTAFAWQLAVGPALARTTTVELSHGVLRIQARDPRWTREIQRAAATILPRLQHLLGNDTITELIFDTGDRHR
jgi:predicted nucleic acid-binding Zn ribbon protein